MRVARLGRVMVLVDPARAWGVDLWLELERGQEQGGESVSYPGSRTYTHAPSSSYASSRSEIPSFPPDPAPAPATAYDPYSSYTSAAPTPTANPTPNPSPGERGEDRGRSKTKMRAAAGAAASLFAKVAKRGKSAAPAPTTEHDDDAEDPDDLAPPVPGHEYRGPGLEYAVRDAGRDYNAYDVNNNNSSNNAPRHEYKSSWEYTDPRRVGSARLVGALEKDVPANQGAVAVGAHGRKASKADAQWSAMMFDS